MHQKTYVSLQCVEDLNKINVCRFFTYFLSQVTAVSHLSFCPAKWTFYKLCKSPNDIFHPKNGLVSDSIICNPRIKFYLLCIRLRISLATQHFIHVFIMSCVLLCLGSQIKVMVWYFSQTKTGALKVTVFFFLFFLISKSINKSRKQIEDWHATESS